MPLIRSWLRIHRLPVAVTAGHLVVILVLFVLWGYERPPKKQTVVKVGLVSLASGGPPTPPSPSPPQKTTPVQKTPTPKPQLQKTPPKETSNPKPKTKPKPKWKPRSVEEIRKAAQANPRNTPQKSPPRTTSTDLSKLQARLNKQLSSGTHASTVHGEPASVSSSYLGKVRALIYQTWRQPSRSEVGNRDHTATIRIQIRRDGTLADSRIVSRSTNLVMNESVKLLLRNLTRVPALPKEFNQSQLRLDITLNLQ